MTRGPRIPLLDATPTRGAQGAFVRFDKRKRGGVADFEGGRRAGTFDAVNSVVNSVGKAAKSGAKARVANCKAVRPPALGTESKSRLGGDSSSEARGGGAAGRAPGELLSLGNGQAPSTRVLSRKDLREARLKALEVRKGRFAGP